MLVRIYTGEKLFKCDACGARLTHRSALNTHVCVHREEKRYKCDTCGAQFTDINALKMHVCIHVGYNLFKCDLCGALFTRRNALTMHMCNQSMEQSHNRDTFDAQNAHHIPYKCDISGAHVSLNSGGVQSDIHNHTTEQLYQCVTRGNRFALLIALQIHERIHTIENSCKCDICGAQLSRRCNIQAHIRSCEKPYKCHMCGKRFSRNRNLKIHIRTHTGEKPYKCDTYGARLSSSHSLRIHFRTHTGEKPYKCDACGTCFSHKCNLKTHKRSLQARNLTNVTPVVYRSHVVIVYRNIFAHIQVKTRTNVTPVENGFN